MKLKINSYSSSLNKAGEEICGNMIETVADESGVTALFCDGEGDGAGASITSSFISRMAVSLLKSGETVDSVVRSVAETYSSAGSENPAPGFSAIRITGEGDVLFAAMNMPQPIVLKRGKPVPINCKKSIHGTRQMISSDFSAKKGMLLVFFNYGLLQAGKNRTGWNDTVIKDYLQSAYTPAHFNTKKITNLLLSAADSLEQGNPEHDISVLSMQLLDKADWLSR